MKFKIYLYFNGDVSLSLYLVWLFISIISFFLICLFLFCDASIIYNLSTLLRTEHKSECILCGMTSAFIAISNGKFNKAINLNCYAILVFIALNLNIILNLLFTFYTFKKKR